MWGMSMTKRLAFVLILFIPNLNILTAQAPGDQVRQEWVARNGGSDIVVDARGDVYVAGTAKYDPHGNALWVSRSNAGFTDIAVDPAGNVYVTGGENGDYATTKYDPQGNEVWVARYNGPENGSDRATAIALDTAGNVYVTGGSLGSLGGVSGRDYATIKYDPQGNELWVARYHGPRPSGDDGATAIAVDGIGNVYVTGATRVRDNADYATIKYDPNGKEVWVATYNGDPWNFPDKAVALALDPAGNVYVTGESPTYYYRWTDDYFRDIVTIKYDPDGNQVWVARYNSGNSGYVIDDRARAMAVDAAGNVYVTGSSHQGGVKQNYTTIKYDPNGNQVCVAGYQGEWNDEASDIAVDPSGSVYVTGRSYKHDSSETSDYLTIKYGPAGNQVWLCAIRRPRERL